jgi:hypothetical protein
MYATVGSVHARQTTDVRRRAPRAERAARAAGTPGEILRLQRLAGNRAVSRAVAEKRPPPAARRGPAPGVLQRCGPMPCDCSPAERASVAREPDEEGEPLQRTPSVQRLDPDFEVKGLSPKAASTPGSVFFDRNSSTIPGGENGKILTFAAAPLSLVTLKGFSSEEEASRPALVDARIAAVEARLRAVSIYGALGGNPTRTPDLASGTGRLDYRGIRRVEILFLGAQSSQPDCSAGADVDPGPAPNGFTTGYEAATQVLLPAAITALTKPADSPAKEALTLFGGAANASNVATALGKIATHFPNMLPHIPLNDPTAPGHRVINACEGDVQAYNQGTGPTARMTVGPAYTAEPDANERGLILIHEASHGALGLVAKDKAYKWQRLLAFLPPAVALQNADSLTQFVALVHDPGAAGASRTDDASALPSTSRRAALEALAWLEQWLVQGRLEVRGLYSAAKVGAWDPDGLWFRDNTMKHVSTRFGLTAPPAVPTADDKATIAGIYDKLAQLRFALTGTDVTLQPGSPSVWEQGPGGKVTLSPAFLAAAKKSKVERLLALLVTAALFVQSGRETAYVGLVKDMAPRFGGP